MVQKCAGRFEPPMNATHGIESCRVCWLAQPAMRTKLLWCFCFFTDSLQRLRQANGFADGADGFEEIAFRLPFRH